MVILSFPMTYICNFNISVNCTAHISQKEAMLDYYIVKLKVIEQ